MPENNEVQVTEAQEILDKVKFELKQMIGRSCIDYGKLLAMLEGKL